ncbi:Protein RALF-like 19 [Apostasia shenzhenica]|uniref:Protein RALF-like 19 n=1 Tax=Apostasia shenzhenica TaxID=1088818 RepID=A0A2I0A818_9ASPA|nr:Protein RALF-like 19 [Apostasia shenzhenica]
MDVDFMSGRRKLIARRRGCLSYGMLKWDQPPCNRRGASYYNCNGHGRVNRRGCSYTNRCARYLR